MSSQQKFWGMPVDTSRVQQLCSGLMLDYTSGKRASFSDRLGTFTIEDFNVVWGYLATLLVALQKVSDPIDAGLSMDEQDVLTLGELIYRHAHDPGRSSMVLSMVRRVAEGDAIWVRRQLSRLYSMDDDSMEECFWALVGSVHYQRFGSYAHSIFVVKAAWYRLMLCKATEVINNHVWCGADWAAAADLVVIMNDRNAKAPGDDRL